MWTIRGALACLGVVLAGRAIQGPWTRQTSDSNWPRLARLIWTAGLLLFWLHMLAAFHYFHDWRHAEAVAATARDSAATIGLAFGGGIYFNYLFAAVWTADVAWWWLADKSYRSRPSFVTACLWGYLVFIAINGAIVFAEGPVRWVSLAGSGIIVALWIRRKLRPSP